MMSKQKIIDYGTTLLLASIPVVLVYQEQIAQHVPTEYALIFIIGMGILSQLASDKRVQAAKDKINTDVDIAQAKIEKYQIIAAERQQQVDELQANIEKVAALKELDQA
jgi:hypothetical protein